MERANYFNDDFDVIDLIDINNLKDNNNKISLNIQPNVNEKEHNLSIVNKKQTPKQELPTPSPKVKQQKDAQDQQSGWFLI